MYNENKNIKTRKLTPYDSIIYPLVEQGKTGNIEVLNYMRNIKGELDVTVTSKAMGQRRMNINPQIYIDMAEDYVKGIYNDFPEELETYKDYYLLAIDGSIITLPNKERTKKEFHVKKDIDGNYKNSRARASCLADINNGYILTSKIDNKSTSEIKLAMQHLNILQKHYPVEKSIITADRAYPSLQMILKIINIHSHFVIRLPQGKYEKEIKQMTSNDEIIDFKLNNRLNNVEPKLRKKYKKYHSIKIRFTKIKLETGEEEILISNLPPNKITTEDLKEIYNRRWGIETTYDRLKVKLEIENFTGYSRTIIEQDFYSHIFLLNMVITEKIIVEHIENEKINNGKLKSIPKINNNSEDLNLNQETKTIEIENTTTLENKNPKKVQYFFKVNINTLVGLLKLELPYLLDEDDETRLKASKRITKTARKNLMQFREDRKRDYPRKKKDYDAKFPQNQRRAF